MLTEEAIRNAFGEPLYVGLLEMAPRGHKRIVDSMKRKGLDPNRKRRSNSA